MQRTIYDIASKPIYYKGNYFDSLLELKFVLSIEDSHAYLREGLEMYYGLNVQPTGIKQNLHCYRPDLLIRNWETSESFIIELKPDGFCHSSLQRRRKIAERFTKQFVFDWQFRVITPSEIHLTHDQLQKFQQVQREQHDWLHKPAMRLLQNISYYSDTQYDWFVRTGFLPALFP